ncbi:sigma factor [Streptomyces cadmiisoli]|uniref:RNA polymerase subunit sigma-70 n=1 Tax=Streptomyces cadmiisoli TaxID=2184053 RepID=A0A2Z4J9T2_9ACTN|nr:sigma factor [Streptomyces cadmiisoli]AWW41690.1 RNA polymerase subunit sigma-70 [Streptomyces cadmiisoli]
MSAPSLETTTPTEPSVSRSAEDDADLALDIFLAQQPRLLRIAHQVLGDVSGAEDVVQDMWLRWQLSHSTKIKNPAAFLTTATTRLAINVIRSARHRHEAPSNSQLADLVDLAAHDPVLRAERTAALEEALALLMAKLTPDGLAAYVLRKGFDYPYADLARLLRTSVPNSRQLVRRAQTQLNSDRDRPVPAEAHRSLVAAFQTAAETGDLDVLTQLLAPNSPVHRLPSPVP